MRKNNKDNNYQSVSKQIDDWLEISRSQTEAEKIDFEYAKAYLKKKKIEAVVASIFADGFSYTKSNGEVHFVNWGSVKAEEICGEIKPIRALTETEKEDMISKYTGKRIRLIRMNDTQAPPVGTCGTVKCIDDIGQIHMHWDNGSHLALIPEVDEFELVDEKIQGAV